MLRFIMIALFFTNYAYGSQIECYKIDNPQKDIKKAISNCKEKIKQGDEFAELELAALYTYTKRYDESKVILLTYTESNNKDALHMLGVMYERGLGVEVNYEEALKWYLKAHELGNEESSYNIGMFYIFGHGVKKQAEKGVEYLLIAAKKGHRSAMKNLGYSYKIGNGVPKDLDKSKYWYDRSKQ